MAAGLAAGARVQASAFADMVVGELWNEAAPAVAELISAGRRAGEADPGGGVVGSCTKSGWSCEHEPQRPAAAVSMTSSMGCGLVSCAVEQVSDECDSSVA